METVLTEPVRLIREHNKRALEAKTSSNESARYKVPEYFHVVESMREHLSYSNASILKFIKRFYGNHSISKNLTGGLNNHWESFYYNYGFSALDYMKCMKASLDTFYETIPTAKTELSLSDLYRLIHSYTFEISFPYSSVKEYKYSLEEKLYQL